MNHPLDSYEWCILADKNGHRYVFRFDLANWKQIQKLVGSLAANPDVDFNWFDAAEVTYRIRSIVMEAEMCIQESLSRRFLA